jgi:hypothetical protein
LSLGGGIELRLRSRLELSAGYRYARDIGGGDGYHVVHVGAGFGFGAQ